MNAQLLKQRWNIEPKRFELLQEAEHDRRASPRKPANAAGRAVSGALIDDYHFVDITQRRRDRAENSAGGVQDGW